MAFYHASFNVEGVGELTKLGTYILTLALHAYLSYGNYNCIIWQFMAGFTLRVHA